MPNSGLLLFWLTALGNKFPPRQPMIFNVHKKEISKREKTTKTPKQGHNHPAKGYDPVLKKWE